MRKSYRIVVLLVFVIIVGSFLCSGCFLGSGGSSGTDDGNGTVDGDGSGDTGGGTVGLISEYYWGKWLRLDKEEYYYFSARELKVTDAEGNELDVDLLSTSENSISCLVPNSSFEEGAVGDKAIAIERDPVFENILTADVDGFYYYFRKLSGLKATLTGNILGHRNSVTAAVPTSRGFSLGALGSVRMIVENLNNEEDTQEIISEDDGSFEIEDIIPEDEYEISIPEESVTIKVKAEEIEDDIGIITVPETDYNYKVTYDFPRTEEIGYFYAGLEVDGLPHLYDVTLYVENIGDDQGGDLAYQLDLSSGIILESGDLSGSLDAIHPGGTAEIPLGLRREAIESNAIDFVEEQIGVFLSSDDGTEFRDRIILRYYRQRIYIELMKIHQAPLRGSIVSPDEHAEATWLEEQTDDFWGAFIDRYYLPYRNEGYDIIIYPARDEPVKYRLALAMGVLEQPIYYLTDMTEDGTEPNDSKESAVQATIPGYYDAIIEQGDVDYFHTQPIVYVEPDVTPPAEVGNLEVVPGDRKITFSWDEPEDEDYRWTRIYYTVDGEDEDPYARKGTTSMVIEELTNGTEYDFLICTQDYSGNISDGIPVAAAPVIPDQGATEYSFSFSVGKTEDELTAAQGKFSYPEDIAVGPASLESRVYVADTGNNRVQVFDSAGNFLEAWGKNGGDGSSGTQDGEFDGPSGIAVAAGGAVYVADTGNNRIQVFDSDGIYLETWGAAGGAAGTGEKEYNQPWGISFDASGNIYIADKGNDRIQVYTAGGAYSSSINAGNGLDGPTSLAFDSTGNIYVTERNGSDYTANVKKLAPDGSSVLEAWPGDLPNPPQYFIFYFPTDIAVDSNDNVYITNRENNQVVVYDPGTESLDWWGAGDTITSAAYGTAPGEFYRPSGICIDESGAIFVLEYHNCRFQKLDTSGNSSMQIGGSSYRTGEGEFYYPENVAVDSSGNIYVTDSSNHRIQKFDSSGAFVTMWGAGSGSGLSGTGDGEFYSPGEIAVDAGGGVYVIDTYNNRIQKFDSDGTFITKWGNNGGDGTSGDGNGAFNNPGDFCLDSSVNIYVADTNNNRIQKFSSGGTFLDVWRKPEEGDIQYWNVEHIMQPSGIGISHDGSGFFVLRYTTSDNTVSKFDANFDYTDINIVSGDNPFSSPRDLETGPNGNVFISGGDGVEKRSFSGGSTIASITDAGGTAFDDPAGLAVGNDEKVYLVDRGAHLVYVFEPVEEE